MYILCTMCRQHTLICTTMTGYPSMQCSPKHFASLRKCSRINSEKKPDSALRQRFDPSSEPNDLRTSASCKTTRRTCLYQNISQYIEEHLNEDLSLDRLAREFYVSKYHIAHIFKDSIGISVHQYINQNG